MLETDYGNETLEARTFLFHSYAVYLIPEIIAGAFVLEILINVLFFRYSLISCCLERVIDFDFLNPAHGMNSAKHTFPFVNTMVSS